MKEDANKAKDSHKTDIVTSARKKTPSAELPAVLTTNKNENAPKKSAATQVPTKSINNEKATLARAKTQRAGLPVVPTTDKNQNAPKKSAATPAPSASSNIDAIMQQYASRGKNETSASTNADASKIMQKYSERFNIIAATTPVAEKDASIASQDTKIDKKMKKAEKSVAKSSDDSKKSKTKKDKKTAIGSKIKNPASKARARKTAKKLAKMEALEQPETVFTGLSSADVKERVSLGLVNGDQNIKTKSISQIIKTNTLTFFNFLFICIAVILIVFSEKNNKFEISDVSNFGFLGIVIINLLMGLVQEIKAKKTIDKLSLLSAPKVTVIRDSVEAEIVLKDIVMDDIMLLSSGRQVCSDCYVVDGSVEVNESQITGEPDAILKNEGDKILSGSYVVSGTAKTKVEHIGKDNYATKISSGAKYIKAPNSEILRSLNRFIKIMAVMIIPLGIALFCVKFFVQSNKLNETVLTVMGSTIGMIPSGLMALTSAVFCISVVRLAKHKTLAQDLYCTETLARVDVLCLDKTGTITEGTMEVVELVAKGALGEDGLKDILKNLNSAIGDTNPTSNAIKAFVEDRTVTTRATDILPFSSARKWSGAKLDADTYIIGAAEFIFNVSKKMAKEIAVFSEQGYRVLALAKTRGSVQNFALPKDIELLAYIVISDKIRQEAPDTLRYFAEQGVAIKIISGDNPVTVKSIAMRAGLADYENYIDASTLTTDDQMSAAIAQYSIFGRVTPDQKLKFVKFLKAQGHTVGMTGDGVNDVLALKESDCSIAMAAGSDAAKNVSQLVLLDSNFASMPKVVAEGRRSINNLGRTAGLYLMKTCYNFLFALLFMIIAVDLPFEPKHLTLIGIVTIGIPSFILALEPNSELVSGKFFSKVVSSALPGAITTAIGVTAISLAARLLPSLNASQVSTMCLIVTVIIGFLFIIKISLPFNRLRAALLISMIALFTSAFFADFSFFSFVEFFGLNTNFTIDMVKILVPVGVLVIPLFIGLLYLMKVLDKKSYLEKALTKLKLC